MNIGPRARRKRLMAGIAALTVGIGVGVGLVSTGADRWGRLGLFFPFWMGALGVFQAQEKT
jgi:hypothetical protein